jgi:GNAT superfamily N-acetyltransferase
MNTDRYRLRSARPDERDRIQEIEDLAGTRFAGLGLIDEALDVGFPTAGLDRLIRAGQVWVACDATDRPVGMVIASVREGAVYVEEMDVLAEHGRRGLGGRLLETVCAWAREHGYAAVTLSTFRDVPWNGPFYRRHGFTDLPSAAWTPGMRTIHDDEGRHGLRTDVRVFMRRDLGAPATASCAFPPPRPADPALPRARAGLRSRPAER